MDEHLLEMHRSRNGEIVLDLGALEICPPTSAAPASWIFSSPPRRVSALSMLFTGKHTAFIAVRGHPPMS